MRAAAAPSIQASASIPPLPPPLPTCRFQIDRRKDPPAPKVPGCVVRFQLTPPEQRLSVPSEAGFVALVSVVLRHFWRWCCCEAFQVAQSVLRLGAATCWGNFHPPCLPRHHIQGLHHRRPLLPLQVKKAFSQRRKVARNSLRPLYEPGEVAAALTAVGLSEDARAQVGGREGRAGRC